MYVDSLEKEGGALIGGGVLNGEFTVTLMKKLNRDKEDVGNVGWIHTPSS